MEWGLAGAVFHGDFPKQAGKVMAAVRVGIQRRPWRSMPKMVVHDHFPLGFGQPVKEKRHEKQGPPIPTPSLFCWFTLSFRYCFLLPYVFVKLITILCLFFFQIAFTLQ
ncbi:MAG: hypothetical protein NC412_08325 [Roseburia sp.]|nr:hypothetical protein [Roseburia sp.]MCM1278855.1 hypothetical protein [Robinsoniella sp.]